MLHFLKQRWVEHSYCNILQQAMNFRDFIGDTEKMYK